LTSPGVSIHSPPMHSNGSAVDYFSHPHSPNLRSHSLQHAHAHGSTSLPNTPFEADSQYSRPYGYQSQSPRLLGHFNVEVSHVHRGPYTTSAAWVARNSGVQGREEYWG
jgi:hypothetical protein